MIEAGLAERANPPCFCSMPALSFLWDTTDRSSPLLALSGGAILHSGVLVGLHGTTFHENRAGEDGLAIMSLGIAENFTDVTFSGQTFFCPAGEYGVDVNQSDTEVIPQVPPSRLGRSLVRASVGGADNSHEPRGMMFTSTYFVHLRRSIHVRTFYLYKTPPSMTCRNNISVPRVCRYKTPNNLLFVWVRFMRNDSSTTPHKPMPLILPLTRIRNYLLVQVSTTCRFEVVCSRCASSCEDSEVVIGGVDLPGASFVPVCRLVGICNGARWEARWLTSLRTRLDRAATVGQQT